MGITKMAVMSICDKTVRLPNSETGNRKDRVFWAYKSVTNADTSYTYFPFGFEGRMWDLIVSVPDHCLSFYFEPGYKNVRMSSLCIFVWVYKHLHH